MFFTSHTGALLWKIEQKTNKAFACGKVTIKGKRHWYEALPQAVFVALSDDTAWIIRTNGDLYLQTGTCINCRWFEFLWAEIIRFQVYRMMAVCSKLLSTART